MEYIFMSKFGLMVMTYDGKNITSLCFASGAAECADGTSIPLLNDVIKQLDEYFSGARHEFSFPVRLSGTPFQLAVWNALRDIPYGETRCYTQIAEAVGRPRAVRAVAAAIGRNPVWVVVPCHRVIGKDGSLAGYAGGLAIKEKLLRLEQS